MKLLFKTIEGWIGLTLELDFLPNPICKILKGGGGLHESYYSLENLKSAPTQLIIVVGR